MKLKPLVLVVGFLVIACAIVYWLRRPPPPAASDARIGQSLVEPDSIAQAAAFELKHAGKTVTLKRRDDGTWSVTAYHDLPADFSKLSSLINDLTESKLQRVVTSRPDRMARLQLGDTELVFNDAQGKELLRIRIGRTAENGGRFVQFGSEEKAYLAKLNSWFDAEPKNWADAKLLQLDPADVARVEVALPDGTKLIAIRGKKDEPWKGEGAVTEGLKTSAVDSLVTELTGLRFSETRDPQDAAVVEAKSHSRTIIAETFGGAKYTFTFSRKPEEKRPKAAAPTPEKTDETDKSSDAPQPAAEPEFETIPAGPAFVEIRSSDAAAPINERMSRRAFEISEWTYNRLPQKLEDWK